MDKVIAERKTLPCMHSDGLYKPTLKHPITFVRFCEAICSKFHISEFSGRMLKLNNCYWLETGEFFKKYCKRH